MRIVKVTQAGGTGIIAFGRHADATLQRRLSKLWCALNCPGRLATANIYFSVPAFVVLFRESLEVHLHCYDLPSMRCCTKDGDCYMICRGRRLLICYCIRQGKESASTPKSLHCAQLWIVKGVAASEPALKHLSTAQHTSFPTRVCGVYSVPVVCWEPVRIEMAAFTAKGSREHRRAHFGASRYNLLVLQDVGR